MLFGQLYFTFQSTRLWRYLPRKLVLHSIHIGSRPIKTPEWPNTDEWNAVLAQSKQQFENIWRPLKQDLRTKTFPVIRRLQKSNTENEHLIHIFRNLTENVTLSTVHWPGVVSLMFSRAVEEAMTGQHQSKNGIEQQQVALAEIINLLYSCLLFRREYLKFVDSQNGVRYDKHSFRLINNYFASEGLSRFGLIKNNQVVWIVAAMMETLANTNSSQHINSRQQTLDAWENDIQNPQSILVANGCRAAMELANFRPGLKELGYQYGKFLTLAAKAHTDIKQVLDYQNSASAYFPLNSLPVILHLQRHPETLAYIHNCKNSMNNLDFHMVYTAVLSSSALQEANRKLEDYIRTTLIILREFKASPLALNLIKLIETLNKFRS